MQTFEGSVAEVLDDGTFYLQVGDREVRVHPHPMPEPALKRGERIEVTGEWTAAIGEATDEQVIFSGRFLVRRSQGEF